MEKVTDIIGVMDPNSFSFRFTFEELLDYLGPKIEFEGKIHEVITQRIKSKPYNVLEASCPYRAIINRGAHWNPHNNSYFMTIGYMTYLLNDMISFQAINKNASYGHIHKLGFHIPKTMALPQQDYTHIKRNPRVNHDLVFSEHEFFDMESIGREIGYPAFLKPQSGGGWVGVCLVDNYEELLLAYSRSGERPMNLQKAIHYREFIRCLGIGPQINSMHYNPKAEMVHDRYLRNEYQAVEFGFLDPEVEKEVKKICKIINAFYKWDHNSCETLLGYDGKCYLIDFANAYPDSTLVSLHFHFPWIVRSMAKWLIFCAVTGRRKSFNFAQDWHEYFEISERADLSYDQKLVLYERLADKYFDTENFERFCREKLRDFDEKTLEFFSSSRFDYIVEKEIEYYFKLPEERPKKLDHYKGIHKFWVHCEQERLKKGKNG